jgi:hypothetical protein
VQRSETVLTSGMTRVLREVLQPGSRVTHRAVSVGPGGGEGPGTTAPRQPVVSITSTHGVTSGFVALSRWPIEELTHYARAQVYGASLHRSDTDQSHSGTVIQTIPLLMHADVQVLSLYPCTAAP